MQSRIAPSWSPDNRRIAFFSAMVGYHLYVQPVDGVSHPEVIFGGPEEKGAGVFTPDGQSYVFTYHKATATGPTCTGTPAGRRRSPSSDEQRRRRAPHRMESGWRIPPVIQAELKCSCRRIPTGCDEVRVRVGGLGAAVVAQRQRHTSIRGEIAQWART